MADDIENGGNGGTGRSGETANPVRKTDIAPVCDEQSGGGGSNPDTRYRGLPGGHPGGALDRDCDPVSRADPEADRGAPRPAGPDRNA